MRTGGHAWVILLAFSAVGQSMPAHSPPQVICRPCGETPPPKGYSCAAGAMIADSVPNAEIAPTVAAACKQGKDAAAPAKGSQVHASQQDNHANSTKAASAKPTSAKVEKHKHHCWW